VRKGKNVAAGYVLLLTVTAADGPRRGEAEHGPAADSPAVTEGEPMLAKLTVIALTLACGSVFAQAPQGSPTRPPEEINPNKSGGIAQQRAAAKTDARTGGNTAAMGAASMDTNRDGMVSKKEWDRYHGTMWRGMKANKQGMVPWADVQSGLAAGQGGTPK
jgi:hypothetical protein